MYIFHSNSKIIKNKAGTSKLFAGIFFYLMQNASVQFLNLFHEFDS